MKLVLPLIFSCRKLAIKFFLVNISLFPLENFRYTIWPGRRVVVCMQSLSLFSSEAEEGMFSEKLPYTKSILTLNFVKEI